MPQQPPVGGFIVNGHIVLVNIIYDNGFDLVRLLGQDPAAVHLHDLVGALLEEAGVGLPVFSGHRVLGLVPVALTGRGRQNGNLFQVFPADAVQAIFHPLRFQTALLCIVHMPEGAAAAELGNRAGPVHPVGGPLQNFRNLPRRPGLPYQGDTEIYPFPGYGIGHEHGAAFNMGNALALGGIVRNHGFVNLIFDQHSFSFKSLVNCHLCFPEGRLFLYPTTFSAPGKGALACFSKKC